MMTSTILCDNCKRDLTDSGAMPAYRIAVAAEKINQSGNFSYAVHVYPPFDGARHFCSLACLREHFWPEPTPK